MTWRLVHADCLEAMAEMAENSIDAVVTDPPYGLHFMGKTWDKFGGPTGRRHTGGDGSPEAGGAMQAGKYDLRLAAQQGFQLEAYTWGVEMLRVLKPGGHLVIFGGTRTYHRLTCALEDAGFEIRDCLAWLYGSGFPKSLDVSKAIDKAAGAEGTYGDFKTPDHAVQRKPGRERKHEGWVRPYMDDADAVDKQARQYEPATPDAERWQGWGTALKPAFEPIVLARKPLAARNVAANVLEYGTGAINVDGCRIEGVPPSVPQPDFESVTHLDANRRNGEMSAASGRWPANVLLDEDAAVALDEMSGERPAGGHPNRRGPDGERSAFGAFEGGVNERVGVQNTTGGASRFFYTAKSGRAERERGMAEYHPDKAEDPLLWSSGEQSPGTFQAEGTNRAARNHHPTVKPVDLMQWLVRLVTPPGGTVLDPFLGSGSTGIAALREGFDFVGIEREAEYVDIARARIQGDAPLFNVHTEEVMPTTT